MLAATAPECVTQQASKKQWLSIAHTSKAIGCSSFRTAGWHKIRGPQVVQHLTQPALIVTVMHHGCDWPHLCGVVQAEFALCDQAMGKVVAGICVQWLPRHNPLL
jgi:hypothetical protein